MTKNTLFLLSAAALLAASCDQFLDTMPDNRADLDTPAKIQAFVSAAYPDNDYILVTEFLSDNVDDYSIQYTAADRFIEQVYAWEDITETNNESPERIWESCYHSIAVANQALASIAELGGKENGELREVYGEALVCRAYAHFILVNLFCLNYNPSTSATDPGIPYMTEPETTLKPDYGRGTVAEVYDQIDKDLQEGLPLIGTSYYSVPKYHFTPEAAYAFAARFYLFYEKWDLAVRYADACLGSSPKSMLRDNVVLGGMPFGSPEQQPSTLHYVDMSVSANLLLLTAYSVMGMAFGGYGTYSKFSHGHYLANTEDVWAAQVWGRRGYYCVPREYIGSLDRVVFWRIPIMFEYLDPVAGIGYNRTVYPALTADECLLNRAEALTMLGRYDEACADLDLWMHNTVETDVTLTPERVTGFYSGIGYSVWNASTIKKHLHPAFEIGEEGGTRESMLQCVLGFRRIETLGLGLRWFDIKRYGIEVERRKMGMNGGPSEKTDELLRDDPRRAVQIPSKVIAAGIQANPR